MNNRDFARLYRRYIGVYTLALLLTLLGINRCTAAEVNYNPEGSPLPVAPMVQAIRYAAEHAWGQYTNARAEYRGLGEGELLDGKIIVRWSYFPLPELRTLTTTPGVSEHSENFGANNTTLGNARWWTVDGTNELLKAVITLNIMEAPVAVDACLLELLVHEFGHVFMPVAAHSPYPEDVMHATRGECRYSPSLGDLQLLGRPLESCYAELTPGGNLEYLDFAGQRVQLVNQGQGVWGLGATSANRFPPPLECQEVAVTADGEVIVNARSFWLPKPFQLRFQRLDNNFHFLSVDEGL